MQWNARRLLRFSPNPATALLSVASVLFGSVTLHHARAACTSPDTNLAIVCSGDLSTGLSYTDGSVAQVTIENLTSDITSDTAIELSDTAAEEASAINLSITGSFDDGFGIAATGAGIVSASTGGDGKDQPQQTNGSITSAGYAADGTSGGVGGNIAISLSGAKALTSSGSGVSATSNGGRGGSGGEMVSTWTNGHGGAGANGSVGGTVTVSLGDGQALAVQGEGIGIAASSQGGNGGNGGGGIGGDVATGYGGAGGAGGQGGTVTINAAEAVSDIETSGDLNHGIVAQSIAGNGGSGGDASGGSGHGGAGGQGGTGGNVAVSVNVELTTAGDKAQGLYARSFGGAGGNGGSVSGVISGSGGATKGPGPGGGVAIALDGSISTGGDEANGILAQSVGGFAGNVGDVQSELVSYGASDQSGGDAGAVSITLLPGAKIATSGDYSAAIDAQSIGGGGGKGSTDTDGFTTLGGNGSAGGNGSLVSIDLVGATLSTTGTHAAAIAALSTGGGGGAGGSVGGINVVGGAGGTGGNGGAIEVSVQQSTISTAGTFSDGLAASSIGGGGGLALSSTGLEVVGGQGGSGGSGSTVGLSVAAGGLTITTAASDSDGILVQSIGGGGGKGAASYSIDGSTATRVGGAGGDGGSGSTVAYSDQGGVTIATSGDRSRGFVAQSIGGGGGQGGSDVSITLAEVFATNVGGTGGDGGAGGNAGEVDVGLDADISTDGRAATAVAVQSIGGGGGTAGSSVSIEAASLSFSDGMSSQTGGDGGNGGDGQAVTLVSAGKISTRGDEADGLLIQSIGGGGGATGTTIDVTTASAVINVGGTSKTAVGGIGGDGGSGGIVDAVVSGDISTAGGNAIGIVAQSIGGGGGKAGTTISGETLSFDDLNVVAGQTGGSGGPANTVTVDLFGNVITAGENSIAVLAQSIGGSGGTGGNVISANGLSLSANLTLGGDGGAGANASDVKLNSSGDVSTAGSNAAALVAQSIGGGGGNGGTSVTATMTMFGVDVTLGSSGGTGSTAGNVELGNSGGISTSGTYGFGALAQSIGGQGGNAGLVANVSVDAGVISGGVDVAIGGNGGDGGQSKGVTIVNSGAVDTTGFGAIALAAQSVGGQGGTGGAVVAGQVDASTDGSIGVNIAVGGNGGTGGNSGTARVVNGGDITTSGHFSDGVLAQSISGNGGAGGSSYAGVVTVNADSNFTATVTVGGNGGDGGLAGDVVVINNGSITTGGGNSNGIYTQSIGGTGGDGGNGLAYFAKFGTADESSFFGKVSTQVGGTGGTGNDAGTVTVTNTGTVKTGADVARAVFAQSVGGGGGDGGATTQQSLGYLSTPSGTQNTSFQLSVTLGGSGGSGGDGEAVIVQNAGTLETGGIASYGIFAQSVGGGGGNASDGVLDLSGWVADAADIKEDIEQAKDIYEDLKNPSSIFTGFSVDVGGSGGASGNGGPVAVENIGSIATSGADATGLFAQSVGGGGGAGGDASQGAILNVTLSGGGGAGGNGDDVAVDSSGTIATSGVRAMGIVAQSVGGGGGTVGDFESVFFGAFDDLQTGSGVNASAGADGNGGDVAVALGGGVSTSGIFGHGIVVQSVGGGGGALGLIELDTDGNISGYTGNLGSAAGAGNGGNVGVTVDGSIAVSGDFAVGLVAQSVGGADSSSVSGDVSIVVSGSVTATGTNGRAIFAQSDGPAVGSGNISLAIGENGVISSENGGDGYDTVGFRDGLNNVIVNNGRLENLTDISGSYAIRADQFTTVTNNGTLTGSLYGPLGFTNNGLFNSGQSIVMSANTAQLVNAGTISPGGKKNIATTTIFVGGNGVGFEQTGDGEYHADVSFGSASKVQQSDQFVISSTAASTSKFDGGTITPHVIGTSLRRSGSSGGFEIFNVSGAVDGELDIGSGLTVRDSVLVDYSLSQDTSGNLFLGYTMDYVGGATGTPLGTNSRRFGNFLDRTVDVVDSALAEGTTERNEFEALVNMALNAETKSDLEALYSEHTPDEAAIGVASAQRAAFGMLDQLQSCPRIAAVPAGEFYHQQECAWSQLTGAYWHQDATQSNPGFGEHAYGFAAGLQRQLTDNFFVEFAGQLENTTVDGANFEQNGYRGSAGVAFKREFGNATASLSAVGGLYNQDYDRRYSTQMGTFSASSSPEGRYLSVEARIAAVFEQTPFYVKPSAGLSATRLWQDAFSESGDGALNWHVDAIDHTSVAFRPSVEIGRSFNINDHWINAFVIAGLTVFANEPEYGVTSSFANLGTGLPDLNTTLEEDRIRGELVAGINMEMSDRLVISVAVEGSLSENARSYGGFGKLRLNF